MSDPYFDDLLSQFSGASGTWDTTPCPAHVPATDRMVEPLGHVGHVGHHQQQGQEVAVPSTPRAAANGLEPPGPEADTDLLLGNLRWDFIGAPLHDIDDELAGMIRLAMLPMGRQARAELAAEIDDHLAEADTRLALVALLEERIEAQGPATWLDWIKAECPLVDGDAEFVGKALERLAPSKQKQAARRYVVAWQAAAEAEAQPHRKANAGRQAANQTLLPVRGRSMATSTTRQPTATTEPPRLPAGVRMAWTVRVGDKRLVLAGVPYTREQAQRAAEARWPGADVEVLTDD